MIESRPIYCNFLNFKLEVQTDFPGIEAVLSRLGCVIISETFPDRKIIFEGDSYPPFPVAMKPGSGLYRQFSAGESALIYQTAGIASSLFASDEAITVRVPLCGSGHRLPEALVELPLLLFLQSRGYHPLHASGGMLGAGILFAGKSGCGKSSLAGLLLELGGKVLADDRVYLFRRDDGKLNCRSGQPVLSLRHKLKSGSEGEIRLNPEIPRPDSSLDAMAPEVLLFPRFRITEAPFLEKISASEAVMNLIPLSLPVDCGGGLGVMASLAKQCESYYLNLPASSPARAETRLLLQERFLQTLRI